MGIFKIIGSSLIIIGFLCGILIFLNPFAEIIKGGLGAIWTLFIFTFLGGIVVYGISDLNSWNGLLKTTGSVLLLIGLFSAGSILLTEINLLKLREYQGTGQLWVLFIVNIIVGSVMVVIGNKGVENLK